jgi:hypothetical protein
MPLCSSKTEGASLGNEKLGIWTGEETGFRQDAPRLLGMDDLSMPHLRLAETALKTWTW